MFLMGTHMRVRYLPVQASPSPWLGCHDSCNPSNSCNLSNSCPSTRCVLLQAASRGGKPLILVLIHGGPLDISPLLALSNVAAVMTAWWVAGERAREDEHVRVPALVSLILGRKEFVGLLTAVEAWARFGSHWADTTSRMTALLTSPQSHRTHFQVPRADGWPGGR
jgi:hypothetical protein